MIIFQPVPVPAPSYVARSLYHRARWKATQRDGSPQLLLAATCEAAPVVEAIVPDTATELHSIVLELKALHQMTSAVLAYTNQPMIQMSFFDYMKGNLNATA